MCMCVLERSRYETVKCERFMPAFFLVCLLIIYAHSSTFTQLKLRDLFCCLNCPVVGFLKWSHAISNIVFTCAVQCNWHAY